MSIIKSKEYLECQALQTLHHICGFELGNWRCSDKPDLQSDTEGYGIEVVQDVHRNEQKMSRFIESIWGRNEAEIDPKTIKKFERLGGSVTFENGHIHNATLGVTTSSPDHLIATVKRKIDLLNERQYRDFRRYGLFVFVETTFIDENYTSFVQQVVDEVSEYQQTQDLKYDILYLEQSYVMCICDLEKKTFQHIRISRDMRKCIYQETEEKCHD